MSSIRFRLVTRSEPRGFFPDHISPASPLVLYLDVVPNLLVSLQLYSTVFITLSIHLLGCRSQLNYHRYTTLICTLACLPGLLLSAVTMSLVTARALPPAVYIAKRLHPALCALWLRMCATGFNLQCGVPNAPRKPFLSSVFTTGSSRGR